MRSTITSVLLGLILTTSSAFAQVTDFKHFGNFKHMVHSGDTSGKVALDDVQQGTGVWGVGALAGLKGEIIQVDGKVLVSLGTDPDGTVHASSTGDSAVLWASGKVTDWQSIVVPNDMSQAEFEQFVTDQAQSAGLNMSEPFIFRVTGDYTHLIWHVVTGEKPAAGSNTSAGHGGASNHGGHGGHGAGHANQQSGMKSFRNPQASGQMVGVYSGDALEGVVSHPGEKFHVHYIDNDNTVSGHVDQYSVKSGSLVWLPKLAALPTTTSNHQPHGQEHHHAPYAGFQNRDIKALSQQQVDDLKAGRGMSLALPAELNGYPGPSHSLELASQLQLTNEQKSKLQALFKSMSAQAKALGLEVIEAERRLDELFKKKIVTAENLSQATLAAAQAQAKLRAAHLRYHLDTVEILDAKQVQKYNELRGYQ